jgi:hypothetical protein
MNFWVAMRYSSIYFQYIQSITLCVMYVTLVFCVTVLRLPLGKNPSAVKIENNNNNNHHHHYN